MMAVKLERRGTVDTPALKLLLLSRLCTVLSKPMLRGYICILLSVCS